MAVYSSRNRIRVQFHDEQTGEAVTGAKVAVYAVEDILKADGTTRISAGDLVTTVSCPNGEGTVEDLYLGTYRLVMQGEDTTGYADADPVEVSLDQTDFPETRELLCAQTTFTLILKDELTGNALTEGTFVLTGEDGQRSETLSVDGNGTITVTGLKRNADYRLTQIASGDGYRFTRDPVSFSVSDAGLIDGSPTASATVTNRILRVSVQAINLLLKTPAKEIPLTLLDASGKEIDSWTDTGSARTFTGLSEGIYTLKAEGLMETTETFEVKDTASIQKVTVSPLTSEGLFVLVVVLGIGAAILLLGAVGIRWLKKHAGKPNGAS